MRFQANKSNRLELARSHHTTTVLGNKAYIFGGKRADGTLCSNTLQGIALPVADQHPGDSEYVCYPAVSATDRVPSPRSNHAACVRGDSLVVHGGEGPDGNPLDESCLWIWSSSSLQWTKISFVGDMPSSKSGHKIFLTESQGEDFLILHGGSKEDSTTETWKFDFGSYAWTELPPAPAVTLTSQFVDSTLYGISGNSDVNGSLHILQLDPSGTNNNELQWTTRDFPTNPLTPGPCPRIGGALVPVATGLGRKYLLYLLGSRRDVKMASSDHDFTDKHPFYSDAWALQLPSENFSASQAKDTVRDYLPGFESGAFIWEEIDIALIETTPMTSRNHPGPRAFFGADICPDGKSVIFWGGLNAGGQAESDGWLVKLT